MFTERFTMKRKPVEVIFNRVSKVIRFALPCSVIGPENSRKIRCKSKTNHDLVARVLGGLLLYFEFSLATCNTFLNLKGHCSFFGFGFTTLNRKAL